SPSLFLRLLAEHRLDARDLAAQGPHLVPRLVLAHRLLDAQAEDLLFQILDAVGQVVLAQAAQLRALFRDLHDTFSSANRVANRVFIGSLADASRIASFASTAVSPSISNRIRPGLMTATQPSG